MKPSDLPPVDSPRAHAEGSAASPERAHRAKEAAREFEAVFVRALLRATPLAKGNEIQGEMVVDAVARSVTAGKGLGMADLIARGLAGVDAPADRGERK